MPRIGKGQKALDRAHKHREDIEHLLATTPHWMLRGWFLDWAEGQLRGGYRVDDLVRAAAAYRADCTEEDEELLSILQRDKPAKLPLWLMLRLVGICRHVASLLVPYTDLETATRTAVREELLS
jgi:hypothetical protein